MERIGFEKAMKVIKEELQKCRKDREKKEQEYRNLVRDLEIALLEAGLDYIAISENEEYFVKGGKFFYRDYHIIEELTPTEYLRRVRDYLISEHYRYEEELKDLRAEIEQILEED